MFYIAFQCTQTSTYNLKFSSIKVINPLLFTVKTTIRERENIEIKMWLNLQYDLIFVTSSLLVFALHYIFQILSDVALLMHMYLCMCVLCVIYDLKWIHCKFTGNRVSMIQYRSIIFVQVGPANIIAFIKVWVYQRGLMV